ncbi:MAG: helix-turn-helix domain-containing protein [Micropepsaceae bacterium]
MRRRAEGRQSSIVAAAIRAFSWGGYAATQIADVARAAGTSVGTVYLYVAGKEALFHAALAEAAGKGPAETETPLAFPGWTAIRDLLHAFGRTNAVWPRLDAALATRGRPSPAAFAGVTAELYDLIAANRVLLRLLDACARDLPQIRNLYEADIKSRYLEAFGRLVARRPGQAASNVVAARAVVELITWMAMHRHQDTHAIPADEAAIRAGTLAAAAAILNAP